MEYLFYKCFLSSKVRLNLNMKEHFILPRNLNWLPEQLLRLTTFNNTRFAQLKFHIL